MLSLPTNGTDDLSQSFVALILNLVLLVRLQILDTSDPQPNLLRLLRLQHDPYLLEAKHLFLTVFFLYGVVTILSLVQNVVRVLIFAILLIDGQQINVARVVVLYYLFSLWFAVCAEKCLVINIGDG